MISVDEALERIFSVVAPLSTEVVPLRHAAGRVLARDVVSTRNQPPFDASVMDGYAVRSGDVIAGAHLKVVGEAAAGHMFSGIVGQGEAVRIFTGAPLPEGADRVVIQEDVTREGDLIIVGEDIDASVYVRPVGTDFAEGDRLAAPRRLSPQDVALIAAMNVPEVVVHKRPQVALLATGDELVMPGETPSASQIVASNHLGLAAMIEQAGGAARVLPIARDTEESLRMALSLADGADLVLTIGGASVGDHDLVGQVAEGMGLDRAFYKVAMRPGKPLMAGRLGGTPMIGLPGNPVSAMVCGEIFVRPALDVMQGLPAAARLRESVPLAAAVGKNGNREHYMRATLDARGVRVADRQDSSLLSVLSTANALVVRAPGDPAREAGDMVDVIRLH